MSSLFKQFEMDETKESEGIEVKPAGPNDDGSIPTFRIARATGTNKRFEKTLTTEVRPFKNLIRLDSLDAKTARRININVFCKSILLGWENVQNKDNQPIPFSLENAISLMNQLPDLYDELNAASINAALFRAEILESDAKNS